MKTKRILIFHCAFFLLPLLAFCQQPPKVGKVIDTFNGVNVYYNGSMRNVSGRHLAPDGYNLGLKYQCVEFVKRYYYEFLKHKMPNSYGHAKDFYIKKLKDGAHNKARNLTQYTNPSKEKPKVNDLIVFGHRPDNPFGHVAIVSKVNAQDIEIVQQNCGVESRINIPLTFKDKRWKIDRIDALGWLRKVQAKPKPLNTTPQKQTQKQTQKSHKSNTKKRIKQIQ